MKEKKKKIGGSTLALIVIFFAGLSLLLYPSVSNFVNERNQSHIIADYTQSLGQMDAEKYEQIRAQAQEYNARLYGGTVSLEELLGSYDSLLNVSGSGIMGYVEIPCIDCMLPIYHGTDEDVLQVAVGHLEWTSLPVGGENTHSVISGHRGLPTAELLTHIDKMELGDRFYIHVLDETLEYCVYNISVVEPEDTSLLHIAQGEDRMTLVTCTPYGVNSHRLLVQGERIERASAAIGEIYVSNEIRPVSLVYVIPVFLSVIALLAAAPLFLQKKKPIRKKEDEECQNDLQEN